VANTLWLLRNGAVGFIDWLSGLQLLAHYVNDDGETEVRRFRARLTRFNATSVPQGASPTTTHTTINAHEPSDKDSLIHAAIEKLMAAQMQMTTGCRRIVWWSDGMCLSFA
jgi:hypothetical protein